VAIVPGAFAEDCPREITGKINAATAVKIATPVLTKILLFIPSPELRKAMSAPEGGLPRSRRARVTADVFSNPRHLRGFGGANACRSRKW
jgi:hypothetical protein